MRNPFPFAIAALALSSFGPAQTLEVPVRNWTVPPYGYSTFGEDPPVTGPTPPRAFVAIIPCRVVDTRNPAGPYGGPALAANVARTFDIDNGPCAGIPAGAEAYSLNFGAILPPADGFLTAWPAGSTQPVVSQLNFLAGEVVANAAIVPAGPGGGISVLVNIGPTNVYIDINGYFTDFLSDATDSFFLVNNAPASATATFVNQASAGNSAGVRGLVGAESGTPLAYGILGFSLAPVFSPRAAGVYGENLNVFSDSAGVYGVDNTTGNNATAGVRGISTHGHGVIGRSRSHGVTGENLDNLDALKTRGYLGFDDVVGVHSEGTITATAMKSFVEPHPTDPTKQITYVSLEGPEAGTYFRGKARLQRGIVTIDVPEDFRLVTDGEGLSVQVTPVGEMATVAVVSIDLDRIVVKGSRDVEFFYTVNGVRQAFKNHRPIAGNTSYVPEGLEARMPDAYAPEQRRRLVATGIYNEDGTVNTETAHRLGWDRMWEKRSRPAPQPPEP